MIRRAHHPRVLLPRARSTCSCSGSCASCWPELQAPADPGARQPRSPPSRAGAPRRAPTKADEGRRRWRARDRSSPRAGHGEIVRAQRGAHRRARRRVRHRARRRHVRLPGARARVPCADGDVYVEDLGSTNGTLAQRRAVGRADPAAPRRPRAVRPDRRAGGSPQVTRRGGTPDEARLGGATDTGRVRDGNEDAYLVDDALELFAVADGMGGHRAGEVASATAIEALRASVDERHAGWRDAIERRQHGGVRRRRATDTSLTGMGTTLTAAISRRRDRCIVGHVGDSRAYLLHDGELAPAHHRPQPGRGARRARASSPRSRPRSTRSARSSPARSASSPTVEVDVYPVDARAPATGPALLRRPHRRWCRTDDIAAHAPPRDRSDRARRTLLVDAANAAGGEDNITRRRGRRGRRCRPVRPRAAVGEPVGHDHDAGGARRDRRGRSGRPTAATWTTPPPRSRWSSCPTAGSPWARRAAAAAAPDATRAQAAVPVTDAPTKGKKLRARPARGRDRGTGARGARAGRAQDGAPPGRVGRPLRRLHRADLADPRARGRRRPPGTPAAPTTSAFDRQGTVTIYQGRPGGLLVWDPTIVRHSTVTRDDLSPGRAARRARTARSSSDEGRRDRVRRAASRTERRRPARPPPRSPATTTSTTTTTGT